MVITKGKAQNVPTSLYPHPHIEIINNAITNEGYKNHAEFIQSLIEDHGHKVGKYFEDFRLFVFDPFLIIILLMLYAYEIRSWPLSILSGILGSGFFYGVFRWTLKTRGKDHRTWWKSKKRHKKQESY